MSDHFAYTSDTLDLRDYLAVLRRRRWTVVLTILLVVASAMAFTLLQTPLYEAETRVLVAPTGSSTDESILRNLVLGDQELETQKELVDSEAVATRVVESLQLDDPPRSLLSMISVSVVTDTQILVIRATTPDPERAAELADGFAQGYLQFRRDQALERAITAGQDLEDRTQAIRDRLDEITQDKRGATGDELSQLEQEENALSNELAQISAQSAALQARESFVRGGGEVVSDAQVPEQPSSPNPLRNGVLAVVLGAMLGVGLAFLRDFLDDAIRSDEEARRLTGRPVLGHIPAWDEDKSGRRQLVTVTEPASPVSESYRTLRTNLRFLNVDEPMTSVLVTSAAAEEGKTTTAANLAVAAARAGTRVILVGGDLRKPTMHESFGMDGSPGVTDVLAGEVPLATALTDVGIANLRVLFSGRVPPNPAELIASRRMTELIGRLEEAADLVVFDAPPILGLADALELVPHMRGVMLVVDVGQSGRHGLRSATERIAGVGGELAGVVMNRIDPSEGYYGYYYTEYYVEEPVEDETPGNGEGRRRRVAGRTRKDA